MSDAGAVVTYEIATEDGKKFCNCRIEGDITILTSKEGSLSLPLLLKQVTNPEVARTMRQKRRKGDYVSVWPSLAQACGESP